MLQYEPGNAVAQEFLPLIQERLKLGQFLCIVKGSEGPMQRNHSILTSVAIHLLEVPIYLTCNHAKFKKGRS